jgi:hypothetical protein
MPLREIVPPTIVGRGQWRDVPIQHARPKFRTWTGSGIPNQKHIRGVMYEIEPLMEPPPESRLDGVHRNYSYGIQRGSHIGSLPTQPPLNEAPTTPLVEWHDAMRTLQ